MNKILYVYGGKLLTNSNEFDKNKIFYRKSSLKI